MNPGVLIKYLRFEVCFKQHFKETCETPLMEAILHQLRLVGYSTIHEVSYIPGGAGFLPSAVVKGEQLFWIFFLEKSECKI